MPHPRHSASDILARSALRHLDILHPYKRQT